MASPSYSQWPHDLFLGESLLVQRQLAYMWNEDFYCKAHNFSFIFIGSHLPFYCPFIHFGEILLEFFTICLDFWHPKSFGVTHKPGYLSVLHYSSLVPDHFLIHKIAPVALQICGNSTITSCHCKNCLAFLEQ